MSASNQLTSVRLTRRSALRLAGAALALPLLPACAAAPAAPTAVPPTAVPKPTTAPVPAAPTQAAASASTAAPAAAASKPAVAAAAPSTGTTSANLTILMWDDVKHVTTVKNILTDLKQKEPNLNVEVQTLPGSERRTKQKLLVTAGTPPDASVLCCGDVAEYGELGLLLKLDPFLKKDNVDKAIYFEGPYWEGLFDANTKYLGAGDLLALPVNFVFTIYYYNKNMLAKAGVKEPDYNWKWEDLLSMAQKLTVDKNGKNPTEAGFDKANVAQYGYFMEWNDYDWVIGAGGRWMTPENKVVINSPENVKGYQFLADMIHKHNVMPTKKTGPEIGLFPTGKNIAIYKAGSWNYTTWRTQLKDFDWDVAPVPIGPLGKRVAYGGSNQFGSWKGVKNPDASWVVVKTLAAPDMTLKHWGSQGIPSVKTSASSPDWPKIANYSERMAKISSEAGGYIQSTDPNIRSSEWKAALSKELDLVWEGSAQVPDALKKAQEQVEKVMARPSA